MPFFRRLFLLIATIQLINKINSAKIVQCEPRIAQLTDRKVKSSPQLKNGTIGINTIYEIFDDDIQFPIPFFTNNPDTGIDIIQKENDHNHVPTENSIIVGDSLVVPLGNVTECAHKKLIDIKKMFSKIHKERLKAKQAEEDAPKEEDNAESITQKYSIPGVARVVRPQLKKFSSTFENQQDHVYSNFDI